MGVERTECTGQLVKQRRLIGRASHFSEAMKTMRERALTQVQLLRSLLKLNMVSKVEAASSSRCQWQLLGGGGPADGKRWTEEKTEKLTLQELKSEAAIALFHCFI